MNFLEKLKSLNFAEPIAVVGMGKSGQSALHFLREAGYDVEGYDEYAENLVIPIDLDDSDALKNKATLVVSPGIDRRKAAIAKTNGIVINDIEIFARLVEKPIAAVTGSNGKSTVVSMLAEAAEFLGLNVRLCGNIGRPVLDALFDAPDQTDLYVVELSSYQLEVCPSLKPEVGAVLNLSPDHLNRYDSYADYVDVKANLARQAEVCVLNMADVECQKMSSFASKIVGFNPPSANYIHNGQIYIGGKAILDCDALSVHGIPNYQNALVTILMADVLGMPVADCASTLCRFKGLPHRMHEVARKRGVFYLDDSKATNIGAVIAALHASDRATWLIVGGEGKGQDFAEFAKAIQSAKVKEVLMIGIDNTSMQKAFHEAKLAYKELGTLAKAVQYASEHAMAGEQVLLSPATASFDQFKGFADRGDAFAKEVSKI